MSNVRFTTGGPCPTDGQVTALAGVCLPDSARPWLPRTARPRATIPPLYFPRTTSKNARAAWLSTRRVG